MKLPRTGLLKSLIRESAAFFHNGAENKGWHSCLSHARRCCCWMSRFWGAMILFSGTREVRICETKGSKNLRDQSIKSEERALPSFRFQSIGNERRSGGTCGTPYWITPVRHEAADAESAPMPLAMPCLVPRHGGGSVARHEHRAKGRFFYSSEPPYLTTT
ncbi:hypothetical protein E5676_scaffold79316G00010 [Cucumis melo var. makuwa]|uniref:Uncharacterized protein n=1 Tax=Cucumis melo var. makuwa TaxID=1194695 RepID=A0A5D3CE05_CUCMM|nr:hypothetical protein E5676_scaffold79316G00010 [Cucumis melo var. makuwa]